MTYNHPSSHVFNVARTRSIRDLKLMYPGEFYLLSIASGDAVRERRGAAVWRELTARQKDSARRHQAESDLKELKARQYRALMELHTTTIRWTWGMAPAGNRAKYHGG